LNTTYCKGYVVLIKIYDAEADEEVDTDLHVTLVLEPWDWKKDCLIETPVLYHTSTSSWMTHINLPAG